MSARARRGAALLAVAAVAAACSSAAPSPAPRASAVRTGATPAPLAATSDAAVAVRAGCRAPVATARPHPAKADLDRSKQTLDALAKVGWNPVAPAASPATTKGGLYVNWKPGFTGADPAAETDIQTDGQSDAQAGAAARHDPLTDLVNLRNIDAFLATKNSDPGIVRLGCLLQPQVEAEFPSYGVDRGYVYFELIDLSKLDSRGPWLADARQMADNLIRSSFDPVTGSEYEKRHDDYRTDYAAETCAAVIDAGKRFDQPSWIGTGQKAADRLVAVAQDTSTGLFPGTLIPVGTSGPDKITDPLAKVGAEGQLFDALLTAYEDTKDPALSAAVLKGLHGLETLPVKDTSARGGWYYAINSDGTGVRTAYRESRQGWMLPLLEDAASDLKQPAQPAAAFRTIVRNVMFRTAGNGYAYRTAASWADYQSKQDGVEVVENQITSEADGIGVQVLLGRLS